MEIQIPGIIYIKLYRRSLFISIVSSYLCMLASAINFDVVISVINGRYKFQWSEYHSGSWRATGDEAGDKMEQWVAAKVNIEKTESDQTADEWRNWEQEIVKICYVCEKILFFPWVFLQEDI